MGYPYRYRQTLVLLKNKYPENLFFCKKKIKKYNYLFEGNDWIIKKTKKNLLLCSLQQYRCAVQQKLQIGTKKFWRPSPVITKCRPPKIRGMLMNNNLDYIYNKERLSKFYVDRKKVLLYTFDHLYSKLLFHGSGYKRVSYFFEKIRERKKLKILYGYYNRKYLQKLYKASSKYNYNSQISYISIFEFNINFILCRCGFYPHIQKAEQMIRHGHYLLNNKNIFSTHMEIKRGDVISIKKKNYTTAGDKFIYTRAATSLAIPAEVSEKAGRQANFFYKKLSIETNKLKYRYLLRDILLNHRKTFYILQKFH
jgi:ribosomal protein S4